MEIKIINNKNMMMIKIIKMKIMINNKLLIKC